MLGEIGKMITNPTGLGIRNDSKGSGLYRAKRGHRLHAGLDFLCVPGQDVVAPISGIVTRKVTVYRGESEWVGLEIVGKKGKIKLFYVTPCSGIIGTHIIEGTVVGIAQDISLKYGEEMHPHVHLEIKEFDPELLI